jgi:hypothetical protein
LPICHLTAAKREVLSWKQNASSSTHLKMSDDWDIRGKGVSKHSQSPSNILIIDILSQIKLRFWHSATPILPKSFQMSRVLLSMHDRVWQVPKNLGPSRGKLQSSVTTRREVAFAGREFGAKTPAAIAVDTKMNEIIACRPGLLLMWSDTYRKHFVSKKTPPRTLCYQPERCSVETARSGEHFQKGGDWFQSNRPLGLIKMLSTASNWTRNWLFKMAWQPWGWSGWPPLVPRFSSRVDRTFHKTLEDNIR